MLMSKFSKRLGLSLMLAILSACSSLPEPEPVVVEAEVAPVPVEPVAEPEPVDLNQQAYTEAITALKGGKADLALELLLQVSREAPDKPHVFTNLGLVYFKLQKSDLAEKAFQQAIEMNSKDAVAYNHLGILQRQKGQFEEALKQYQRAIQIDRNYARAHLNLGILFDIYLQDLGKALQQYEKYQALTSEEDSQVTGWIVDIQRQIKSSAAKSQG